MDIAVITFYQVLRVLLIVGFVPLMVAGSSQNAMIVDGGWTWGLAGFLAICGLAGWLAQWGESRQAICLGQYFY